MSIYPMNSDRDVGRRLRAAREEARKTQDEAAIAIGVARTTLVAIEKGQRKVRIDELQRLAFIYGTTVNRILAHDAVQLDLAPQFRKLSSSCEATASAAMLLTQLVQAELELENALGVVRSPHHPPERPVMPGDVLLQAEQDTQWLRDWLGLGDGPVLDAVSLMELQLGVRVYLRPLDPKISGLFAFDEQAGACVMLNSNHPIERRANSAVHEMAHFIGTRHEPEALCADERFSSRQERYAQRFAQAFLMPARALKKAFEDLTSGQSNFTRHHVILLAYMFRVSREALVRRLEDLKLVNRGTWDWFVRNGGITKQQASVVLGSVSQPEEAAQGADRLIPHRLALLAREAARRLIYSEGQLASLLKVDRLVIRELLEGIDEEEQLDGQLRLSR